MNCRMVLGSAYGLACQLPDAHPGPHFAIVVWEKPLYEWKHLSSSVEITDKELAEKIKASWKTEHEHMERILGEKMFEDPPKKKSSKKARTATATTTRRRGRGTKRSK